MVIFLSHLSSLRWTRFPLPRKQMLGLKVKHMPVPLAFPAQPIHFLLSFLHHGFSLLHHLHKDTKSQKWSDVSVLKAFLPLSSQKITNQFLCALEQHLSDVTPSEFDWLNISGYVMLDTLEKILSLHNQQNIYRQKLWCVIQVSMWICFSK